ncbi:helix-turn-helix domain-containing protein [Pyruvatibacter mobilis]|uniref:helix-turn-helix domain-containing protein n=1 Tax=Pyruvatibacter mobilis TaxID=1712261 RepID=UPI003BAD60CC
MRSKYRTGGLSPQCVLVLEMLEKNQSLSSREALLDGNVQALPRRIADLKEAGFDIQSEMRTNPSTKQRYKRYWLGDNHMPHRVATPYQRSLPLAPPSAGVMVLAA